jgi:hypothetical protein
MNSVFSKNKKTLGTQHNKICMKDTQNTNIYKYNILDKLEQITHCLDNINVCVFNVNDKMPILSYFLIKDNNTLTFPNMVYSNDILEKCESYTNQSLIMIGYKVFNKQTFMFFNSTQMNESDIGHWCIMDEICNKKKFIYVPIREDVTNFFFENDYFIFLRNRDDLPIETPIIAYRNSIDILELMHNKFNNNFTHFNDINNINKKYILRFALFIGHNNLLFNNTFQYKISYKTLPLSIHE